MIDRENSGYAASVYDHAASENIISLAARRKAPSATVGSVSALGDAMLTHAARQVAEHGTLAQPESLISVGGGRGQIAARLAYLLPQSFDALRAAPLLTDGTLLDGLAGLCHLASSVFAAEDAPHRESVLTLLRGVALESDAWQDRVARVLDREGRCHSNPITAAVTAWMMLDSVASSAWWWHFSSLRRHATLGAAHKHEGLLLLLTCGAHQMAHAAEGRERAYAKLVAQGFARWLSEIPEGDNADILFRLATHNMRQAAGARWGLLLQSLMDELPVLFGGLADLNDEKLVRLARQVREEQTGAPVA